MSNTTAGAATAREREATPPSEPPTSRPEQLSGTMPQPLPEETSRPTVDAMAGPTDQEIARRAYELYLARGGEHGFDMDDWIQAESELRNPSPDERPR